jgi:hypothetical protein
MDDNNNSYYSTNQHFNEHRMEADGSQYPQASMWAEYLPAGERNDYMSSYNYTNPYSPQNPTSFTGNNAAHCNPYSNQVNNVSRSIERISPNCSFTSISTFEQNESVSNYSSTANLIRPTAISSRNLPCNSSRANLFTIAPVSKENSRGSNDLFNSNSHSTQSSGNNNQPRFSLFSGAGVSKPEYGWGIKGSPPYVVNETVTGKKGAKKPRKPHKRKNESSNKENQTPPEILINTPRYSPPPPLSQLLPIPNKPLIKSNVVHAKPNSTLASLNPNKLPSVQKNPIPQELPSIHIQRDINRSGDRSPEVISLSSSDEEENPPPLEREDEIWATASSSSWLLSNQHHENIGKETQVIQLSPAPKKSRAETKAAWSFLNGNQSKRNGVKSNKSVKSSPPRPTKKPYYNDGEDSSFLEEAPGKKSHKQSVIGSIDTSEQKQFANECMKQLTLRYRDLTDIATYPAYSSQFAQCLRLASSVCIGLLYYDGSNHFNPANKEQRQISKRFSKNSNTARYDDENIRRQGVKETIAIIFAFQQGSQSLEYRYFCIPTVEAIRDQNIAVDLKKLILEELLSHPEMEKYLYNAKNIICALLVFFGERTLHQLQINRLFDSQIAAWLVDPDNHKKTYYEFDKLLQFYASNTTTCSDPGWTSNISVQKLHQSMQQSIYLWPKLRDLLQQNQLIDVYFKQESLMIALLAEMQHTGVACDVNQLRRAKDQMLNEIRAITDEIHRIANSDFNVSSSQQLAEVLFDTLKYQSVSNTAGGARSTANKSLKALIRMNKCTEKAKFLQLIILHRKLSKLLNTYVEPMTLRRELVPEGNTKIEKIFCSWNQICTGTGRLSATNPNLQALPKFKPNGNNTASNRTFTNTIDSFLKVEAEEGSESEDEGAAETEATEDIFRFQLLEKINIRSSFIPSRAGYDLLSADYSQMEMVKSIFSLHC